MENVMDIKFVLLPKEIPVFSSSRFPFAHILPGIYIPPAISKEDKMVYNLCAHDADADYNKLCAAVSRCNSPCGNLRKVVSHIFGRNKTCTMQIPEACITNWCRIHYQRFKYRSGENWIKIQIEVIRSQLDRIEDWGGARSWTIGWCKSEKAAIDAENDEDAIIPQMANDDSHYGNVAGFTAINPTPATKQARTSSARFLSSYIGKEKTLDQVRATIDAVEKWAETPSGHGRHFPQIEFLPDIDKKIYPPASKRKELKGPKPLASTAVGSSSLSTTLTVEESSVSPATVPSESSSSSTTTTAVGSLSPPTVVLASTSSVKKSLDPPRRNPARGVKRSRSNACGDEATDDHATTKTNPSTKRRQPQGSLPCRVTDARASKRAQPGRKESDLEDMNSRRMVF